MPRTILYIRGFHASTRARDLAYEFERYGPLIRCDIPAPRGHGSGASPHTFTAALPLIPEYELRAQRNSLRSIISYAFIEFRSSRDASAAFDDMHGRYFEGSRLTWAKRLPSSMWRSGRSPRRGGRYRDRSRSPRRGRDRDYDRDDRRRSRSRSLDRRDRDDDDRDDVRDKERRRSESPDRKGSYSRDRSDRARTPPPPEDDLKKVNGDADGPALSEA
ncbi:hypothetical protein A7U60_g6929 [Sanghuangporus baumii]|uniref:RRM domain-containing protein n=1 Tax=Sanghuangporus baumii TaxID=108892 RepID=A0A9Q5HU76_SANBA|nr:hypothetical protein A7U60_g6929 [Sanghuangporus baumii]